jgi:Cdc6-like AAA superfamily ATPase
LCGHFGDFPKGPFKEENINSPILQIGSIDQPIFVARQKDMFKLIQKILSPKSSRLLTLLGLPGIGKSSLARKTIQHINERMLLPGGYIMLNVRGIKYCEDFLRTFIKQVAAKGNPMSADIFVGQEQGVTYEDSFSITTLILEKFASIQKKILLVIDNAEDLISSQDKHDFKSLVLYFLNQVPTLQILMTTR